jgi:hypothetical protein
VLAQINGQGSHGSDSASGCQIALGLRQQIQGRRLELGQDLHGSAGDRRQSRRVRGEGVADRAIR